MQSTFSTMAEARQYLSDVRAAYAKESPKGEKSRNRWTFDRTGIHCLNGSDQVSYHILKCGKA
jgi:hypothetical protein